MQAITTEAIAYALVGVSMICVGCMAVAAYCTVRCHVAEQRTHRAVRAVGQVADEVRRRGVRIAELVEEVKAMRAAHKGTRDA